jgi:hypothetical protein
MARQPKPGDQTVDRSGNPLVTTGSGDVFKDLGRKPAGIGDLVDFRDNSDVRWRGALVDIREMVTLTSGVMIRKDEIESIPDPGIRGEARMLPTSRWGFVAVVAQPTTTAVRLDMLSVVDDGWWPRNLPRTTVEDTTR